MSAAANPDGLEAAVRSIGEVCADLRRPEVLNALSMRELAAIIHVADDVISLGIALAGPRERAAILSRERQRKRDVRFSCRKRP